MIRNILRLLGIDIHSLDEFSLCESLGNQLESLPAAHPLLQIMPPLLESVFDDGEHRGVELRDQLITRADEYLDLVRLCPRLIEPLPQVVEIESDKIDHRPSGNSYPLPFLDDKCPAGIFRHDHVL